MWSIDANGGQSTNDPNEIKTFFAENNNNNQDKDKNKKKDNKQQPAEGEGNKGKTPYQQDSYKPVPKEYKKDGLPGFPGSSMLPPKSGARPSFDLGEKVPKGWLGEWDSQHGEIEVYDKKGKHQGAWDTETGNENECKQKDNRIPSYKRIDGVQYDNAFVHKVSEVTGLTGSALVVYFIISGGTRIIPIRNVIPIP
nr:colicin E3/pyocin S6 family cytotoxin [[Flexibacter] sp. ATCC 35208]